jgi:potassium efflux system protein
MNEQYAELITRFPLFHGFTVHGTQRLLDEGEIKEYAPGEVLIREGDPPAFVSLVLTGNLEVFVEREGKHLVLTTARPGSILGELAVLCGIPRSASVRASEKSIVLQWSADAFRTMLIRDPSLSEHIFQGALRILIDKERSLIDSLVKSQAAGGQG